ncbi:MAG: site-specific DNA-methyltransferase, partial [Chloroflexota bacterium]|nr:site-specific DNA-methyltransferase [Chloroflexota bacterium]
ISKAVGWQGGGSFIACELMQWNARYIAQIGAAQSTEELEALWEKMQEQAFLSYKVDYAHFDEHAEEFAQLRLADQKRFLLAVLDKNQLYVNLSEIDDGDYEVSEEDKRLNRMFYVVR